MSKKQEEFHAVHLQHFDPSQFELSMASLDSEPQSYTEEPNHKKKEVNSILGRIAQLMNRIDKQLVWKDTILNKELEPVYDSDEDIEFGSMENTERNRQSSNDGENRGILESRPMDQVLAIKIPSRRGSRRLDAGPITLKLDENQDDDNKSVYSSKSNRSGRSRRSRISNDAGEEEIYSDEGSEEYYSEEKIMISEAQEGEISPKSALKASLRQSKGVSERSVKSGLKASERDPSRRHSVITSSGLDASEKEPSRRSSVLSKSDFKSARSTSKDGPPSEYKPQARTKALFQKPQDYQEAMLNDGEDKEEEGKNDLNAEQNEGGDLLASLFLHIPDRSNKNASLNKSSDKSNMSRSMEKGNISKSYSRLGKEVEELAGNNVAIAIPLATLMKIKKLSKQRKKIEDKKSLNQPLTKEELSSYAKLSRSILEEMKDANIEEDEANKQIEEQEEELNQLEQSILNMSEDADATHNPQLQNVFLNFADKLKKYEIKERQKDEEQDKKTENVLAKLEVGDLVKSALLSAEKKIGVERKRSGRSALNDSMISKISLEEEKKDEDQIRLVEFLKLLHSKLKDSTTSESEAICKDLLDTIAILTQDDSELTDDEKRGLTCCLWNGVEEEFIKDKIEFDKNDPKSKKKAKKDKARRVREFADGVRAANVLGQVEILEIMKLAENKELKIELVKLRSKLIDDDQITKGENPNYLEIANMHQNKKKLYHLIKKLGREILPPREIEQAQGTDEKEVNLFIPAFNKKGGIEKSLLSSRVLDVSMNPDEPEEDKETKKKFDRARKVLMNLERAGMNTLDRARELFSEIEELEELCERGEDVPLSKRIRTMERAKDVMGAYSEIESYSKFYTKQYQVIHPDLIPPHKTMEKVKRDMIDLQSGYEKKDTKFVTLIPLELRPTDLNEDYEELKDLMRDLREASHGLAQKMMNVNFTQVDNNKGVKEDVKMVRNDLADVKNIFQTLFDKQEKKEVLRESNSNFIEVTDEEEELAKSQLNEGITSLAKHLTELKEAAEEREQKLEQSRLAGLESGDEEEDEDEIREENEKGVEEAKTVYGELIEKSNNLDKAMQELEEKENNLKGISSLLQQAHEEGNQEEEEKITTEIEVKKIELEKARVDTKEKQHDLTNLMNSLAAKLAVKDEDDLDDISKKMDEQLQNSRLIPESDEEVNEEELKENRDKFKTNIASFLGILKETELHKSQAMLEEMADPFNKSHISASFLELEEEGDKENSNIIKRVMAKTVLGMDTKISLLRNIIIKNLNSMPRYTKKDIAKADQHTKRIDKLIEDVKLDSTLKLGLLSKLKGFCQKMLLFNTVMLKVQNLSQKENERLQQYIDNVNEAVDKAFSVKIDKFNAEIHLEADILKEKGEKLGVNLDENPTTNLEKMKSLDVDNYTCTVIRNGLHNLNMAIINCSRHIQEALFLKSQEAHESISKLDPARVLDKKNMSNYDELIIGVQSIIQNESNPFSEKSNDLINQVRSIENVHKHIESKEILINPKLKKKIADEETYFTEMKHKLLKMNGALGSGIQHINLNCLNLIRTNSGEEGERFKSEFVNNQKKIDIPQFIKIRSQRVIPINFEKNCKLSLESEMTFNSSDEELSHSGGNELKESGLPVSLDDFFSTFLNGAKELMTDQEKKDEQKIAEQEYVKIQKIAEVEGVNNNLVTPETAKANNSLFDIFSKMGLSNLNKSGFSKFGSHVEGADEAAEEFKKLEEEVLVEEESKEEETIFTDDEDSYYIPIEENFLGQKINTLKRIINTTRVPKALKRKKVQERLDLLGGDDEQSDSDHYEDFYFLENLPSSMDKANPEGKPVYKKRKRKLNPQEIKQKKQRALHQREEQEDLDELDDDEVIKETVIVPTDDWANGMRLFLKKTIKIPIVADLDLDEVKGEEIEYFKSEGKEERGKRMKFKEIIGFVKRFVVDFKPKNARYVLAKDKIAGKSLVIIKLGEKGLKNSILVQQKDPMKMNINLLIKKRALYENKSILLQKEFSKLDPQTSPLSEIAVTQASEDPYSTCITKGTLAALLKSVSPSTMLFYYEEIGQEVDGKRVIEIRDIKEVIGDDPQFESLNKIIEVISELLKVRDAAEGKAIEVETSKDGKKVIELTMESDMTQENDPVKLLLQRLQAKDVIPEPGLGDDLKSMNRSMNKSVRLDVSKALSRLSRRSNGLIKDEEQMMNENVGNLLKNQISRLFSNVDPMLESKRMKAEERLQKGDIRELDLTSKEVQENRDAEFKEEIKQTLSLPEMLKALSKVTKELGGNKGQLKEMDRRFEDIKEEARKRGIVFDDVLFPSNSSSMVNNSRKTEMEFSNLQWKSLSDIYEKLVVGKDFLAKNLFPPKVLPAKLAVCLNALSVWPDRIKRILGNSKIDELYMIKLNVGGDWLPFFVDDKVPITNEGEPFVMCPTKHIEGLKIPENHPHARKLALTTPSIDIWPQLIAKALSKSVLNYERLLNTPVPAYLRALTGMPMREYKSHRFDFSLFRVAFKKSHIVIAEADNSFIELVSKRSSMSGDTPGESLKHWVVHHVLNFTEDDCWIEVGHPFCLNTERKRWTSAEDLMLSEDWRQYRKFKKTQEPTFWLHYGNFCKYFSSATICKYSEDIHSTTKPMMLKGGRFNGNTISVSEITTLNIEVVQEGKPDQEDHKHSYPDIRVYILKERMLESGNSQLSIVKAIYNQGSKSVTAEMKVDKGTYTVIIDNSGSSTSDRKCSLVVHSLKGLVDINTISSSLLPKIVSDLFCNLTIERGEVQKLNSDGSVRKYMYSLRKTSLVVFTYVNRSSSYFNLIDLLEVKGKHSCSKVIRDGKLKTSLPPNSKKYVVFWFYESQFEIKVIETSLAIRI